MSQSETIAVNGHGSYATRWRRFLGGTIAVSLAPSALVVRPAVLLGTAAAGALVAVIASLVISSDLEESLAARLVRVRQAAAWGASSVAAIVFVGTVSGTLLWWTLLLALVTSPAMAPPALGVVARLSRPVETTAGLLPIERASREVLVKLTSAELCQAWCSTHHRLRSGPPAEQVAAYARLRQMVLDELERRHPQEVAEWLSAGGNAEAAPERFLPLDPHNG